MKVMGHVQDEELELLKSEAGPQVSFGVASQKAIYKSLERTVTLARNRRELFLNLTSKLDKFFAIHKGSYSTFDPEKSLMRVPLVLQENEVKSGIVISIAGEKSLMRNVLKNVGIYVEDFPRQIVGNIIERKLLLLDKTNSLAIVPLTHEGIQLGTLNYASSAPFAFSVFSSHLFDYLFLKVAKKFAALKS